MNMFQDFKSKLRFEINGLQWFHVNSRRKKIRQIRIVSLPGGLVNNKNERAGVYSV